MSSKSWRPRTGRGWPPATRTGGAARHSSWEAFGGDIWRDLAFYTAAAVFYEESLE